MKISIFTTITNPDYWQYAWKEAIACYETFADEVIVVDGSKRFDGDETYSPQFELNEMALCGKVKVILYDWPYEWHWSELPKHIQKGFEQCTGDVAIKMDIDYLIHEQDFYGLKKELEAIIGLNFKLGNLKKFTILNKKKGYEKANLPIIVNMKYKDEIAWGVNDERKTDWCFPITKDRQDEFGVWHGKQINPIYQTGYDIYNYDYFFRTEEKAEEAFWRFSKAWNRGTGDWSWGNTKDEALAVFKKQLYGRLKNQFLKDVNHPKFIRERINNMKPEEQGFSNWL